MLTSLTKQAMPVIRYRTRDLTRLLLTRSGALDELAVRVERRPDAAEADAVRAGEQPQERVENVIGVSVAVRVLAPDGVERSLGKMRRVLDERPVR